MNIVNAKYTTRKREITSINENVHMTCIFKVQWLNFVFLGPQIDIAKGTDHRKTYYRTTEPVLFVLYESTTLFQN